MAELFLAMQPRPKERPRAAKNGVFYTPKTTLKLEKQIRDAWREAGLPKFDGPVEAFFEFTKGGILIQIDSLPGAKSGLRGDIDNYVKLVSDGLNNAAYLDDGQVHYLRARKG